MVYTPAQISGNRGYKWYAKTLFKPQRPHHIDKPLSEYTRRKVPYFFMYAKDKARRQVESKNTSTVNMLRDVIPNDDIVFSNINVGKFDYTTLMKNKKLTLEKKDYEIIKKYQELDLHKYFFINYKDRQDNNLSYIYQDIREQLLELDSGRNRVSDVLIKYLYLHKESSYKTTLWEVFGEEMVKNLRTNIARPLGDNWVMCEGCGERVEKTNNNTKFCRECYKQDNKKKTLARYHRKKFNIFV